MDFMKRAIQIAKDGVNNNGGPFGAVVVKNGKIIAESYNKVTMLNDPTAHAEVLAIRKACNALNSFDLSGCDIYSSCEPCPMCLGAMYWARINKLYYSATRADAEKAGFDDSVIYQEFTLLHDDRKLITTRIKDAEAQSPFKLWKCKEDKICY